SMVLRERPSGSLRSKPALKALALPVSTTTEVAPSSSKLRAALVNWRIASGDSALMPSPRSKRTTAIRPSGPSPFSIVTNGVTAAPPCPLFFENPSSQMAGTLACGPTVRRRKADRGADRDPVGVFSHYVAAIDQVDRKNFVWP